MPPTESDAMTRVRHIATSWEGHRVAVAECDRRVAVWDVVSAEKVSEFDTVLDFGGTRLAITQDGERVIAGAYHRYGIACYDASTGVQLWQRKDLKKVQYVGLSHSGVQVYCGFERRAGRVLDLETGADLEVLHGVASVTESPFNGMRFIERKAGTAQLRSATNKRLGKVERTTFAFLSVAFTPNYLVTSESTGPIRCFDLLGAQEMWRVMPPYATHAMYLGYDIEAELCQAITWSYSLGGRSTLLTFDPTTGAFKGGVGLPESPVFGFCLRGTRLLAWDGSFISAESGEVISRFEFPDTSLY